MRGLFLLLICFFASYSFASNVATLSYSSTNVSTSAYSTFVASTPINSNHIVVCDTSAQVVKLATGASSSEVDLVTNPVSGCLSYNLSTTLPAGTRLSLKAISATASTGFATVSFFP